MDGNDDEEGSVGRHELSNPPIRALTIQSEDQGRELSRVFVPSTVNIVSVSPPKFPFESTTVSKSFDPNVKSV